MEWYHWALIHTVLSAVTLALGIACHDDKESAEFKGSLWFLNLLWLPVLLPIFVLGWIATRKKKPIPKEAVKECEHCEYDEDCPHTTADFGCNRCGYKRCRCGE